MSRTTSAANTDDQGINWSTQTLYVGAYHCPQCGMGSHNLKPEALAIVSQKFGASSSCAVRFVFTTGCTIRRSMRLNNRRRQREPPTLNLHRRMPLRAHDQQRNAGMYLPGLPAPRRHGVAPGASEKRRAKDDQREVREVIELARELLALKARGVLANVWIDAGTVRVSYHADPFERHWIRSPWTLIAKHRRAAA